jgi:purine-binding chemotaxis protein CheW
VKRAGRKEPTELIAQVDAQTTLRERARKLAAERESMKCDETGLDVVLFELAMETYGLETRWISEVAPLRRLTKVPGTPPFIMGITGIRGRVVSLVDLRVFFELPVKGITQFNRLLLLEGSGMEFCIVADRVVGTSRVNPESLCRDVATLTGVRRSYLLGVAGGPIIILDGEKLLEDQGLIVNAGAGI